MDEDFGLMLAIGLGLLACLLAVVALATVSGLKAQVASLKAAMTNAAAASPASRPAPMTQPPPLPEIAPAPATAIIEEAPQPPPLPPTPVEAPALPKPAVDLELLLTQRWGVWLGSVALLFAGVFLVRFAVEQGWLGPAVRCALGGLLGIGLIAGAWWLRARPGPALPLADHAPAGLAAGGVAVLFAAACGAGPLYGLVPELLGFLLLAAAGLAGLALSLLFGPLVAAVGLVAAFVTPVLVHTVDPSLPGLFAYLLVVSAACWAVVRVMAWTWLGWAAAAGGAIWVFLSMGAPADHWAPGLFVPAAAALTLALLPTAALDHPVGRRFAWAPLLMLGLAGLALLSRTGDPLVRVGVLTLGPVAMVKAAREPRLAWLPMVTAALSVLALLLWAVPAWVPTGEAVTIEGVAQAVLPGAWAPDAIVPLLQTAGIVMLLHLAAGLWWERRSPNPLPWSALAAGVPVIVLAAAYAQVGRFQAHAVWALGAAGLAAVLVVAAGAAMREAMLPRQRAGVHAAGAVAALALGCAIVLDDAWLTVALALMLPALAAIERAAALPELRRVALVIACVVLARLVLNPWVAGYDFGTTPVLNGLLVAYGLPALCFATAAWMVRQQRQDTLVAVLEAGASAFAGLLLVLEIHHGFQGGLVARGWGAFPELAWQVSVLGAFALLLRELAVRLGRRVLDLAGQVAGALALAGGVLLFAQCPLWSGAATSALDLVAGYIVPAGLALVALGRGGRPHWLLGGYAVIAGLLGSAMLVRVAFHAGPIALESVPVEEAEVWTLSCVWFALAALTMASGFLLRQRAVRMVGLGLVALVAAKVFLFDMAGLGGLWRVLSFLGLGLSLIGLGAVYRRVAARA